MGVNHVHAHDDEPRSPEEAARERADRFAAALEAVLRDHREALARADLPPGARPERAP
ncbi:MAG: hypothetical protein M9894_05645 [Planctomycetes bacterium]|nr:hypothetical protein [Planctomycetota bacterium]